MCNVECLICILQCVLGSVRCVVCIKSGQCLVSISLASYAVPCSQSYVTFRCSTQHGMGSGKLLGPNGPSSSVKLCIFALRSVVCTLYTVHTVETK